MRLEYGTKTTKESYYNGSLKKTKIEYSIPQLIIDRTQLVNEMLKALELINSKQTTTVTLVVDADPKNYSLKMLTKKYIVSE